MKKILLVDDDLSFLRVVKHVLRKRGYQVVTSSSGEEAIDLLRSNGFALVISDFKMGRVSGLKIAKIALGKNPPIPVFMLTAYAEGLMRARNEGFWGNSWERLPDRVFSKPVDEEALVDAIESLGSEEAQDKIP